MTDFDRPMVVVYVGKIFFPPNLQTKNLGNSVLLTLRPSQEPSYYLNAFDYRGATITAVENGDREALLKAIARPARIEVCLLETESGKTIPFLELYDSSRTTAAIMDCSEYPSGAGAGFKINQRGYWSWYIGYPKTVDSGRCLVVGMFDPEHPLVVSHWNGKGVSFDVFLRGNNPMMCKKEEEAQILV